MSNFLAVFWRTDITQHAQAGVPAEFDDSVPPVEITPAVPAVPELTVEVVDKIYIETNAATVAKNLASDDDRIEYYELDGPAMRGGPVISHLVRLKAGPRTPAPAREVAEVEANGQTVGSTEVVA